MNVRRMVMVMLLLGVLVQGATAYTTSNVSGVYTMTIGSSDPLGTYYYNLPISVFYYSCSITGATGMYTYAGTGDTYRCTAYDGNSDSNSGAIGGGGDSKLKIRPAGPGLSSGFVTASADPPNTASGESCTGTGTFTYYQNNVLINYDAVGGAYSFSIFDGIEYQIYYDETDEWHNFTATASDETWNPSCPGTYTVSGTLLGPDGEGTNNALMALMYVQPPDPDNLTAANTEASYSSSTGEYSFSNIYPGAYFVVACGPGPCYPYGSDWFYVTDSDVTVTNLTYPEKINIRFRVLDANSTPQSGLYLHLQDAPIDYGGWMSTDADGYTSYNPMYPSAIYVELVDEDMTTLATTTITGNAQYEYQMSTITLPAPDATNTTIPVIPPDSDNSTPPTQPPAGGGDIGGGTVTDPGDYACTNTLTASVQDADHVAIVGAAVKLYPYNSSISGSHSGTTDAAGEYTFPCTNATLSYNVEARATCYEHEISEDEGYSGTAYFHLNKTLTLACGFDDGSGGGGTGTNGTDSGDPDLIAEVTVSDDAMKAPILNYLFGGFLLVIFYMVATFYKKK